MYQKYSIGTMAKLMGISAEAIRYYESRNIISPVRDPETGYRYYNTWDFHMLLRARHYQNYGFSLEEIGELFRSGELSQVREKMEDQEAVIEKEIIRLIQNNKGHVDNLSIIHEELKKKFPDFDVKQYGFSRISSFIRSFGTFKIKDNMVQLR